MFQCVDYQYILVKSEISLCYIGIQIASNIQFFQTHFFQNVSHSCDSASHTSYLELVYVQCDTKLCPEEESDWCRSHALCF